MQSRYKSLLYMFLAIISILAILIFNNQIVELILFVMKNKGESGDLLCSDHDRYFSIVRYLFTGVLVFSLLCLLEYNIQYLIPNKQRMIRISRLALVLIQVIVVFVFGDIVFQNASGEFVAFEDFKMAHASIGGLLGVMLCILRNFFESFKKENVD